MKLKRYALLPLLALALPLLALACGDETTETPGQGVVRPVREILGSLPLKTADFAQVFPNLAPMRHEGPTPVSNEQLVDEAVNPDDTRNAIEKYNRISGAGVSYVTERQEEGLGGPGNSARYIGYLDIHLFSTDDGAGGFFQFWKGLASQSPFTSEIQKFDVSDVGDEAVGFFAPKTPNEGPYTASTLIMTRIGPLVVVLAVNHRPDQDAREGLRRLAQILAENVEARLQPVGDTPLPGGS